MLVDKGWILVSPPIFCCEYYMWKLKFVKEEERWRGAEEGLILVGPPAKGKLAPILLGSATWMLASSHILFKLCGKFHFHVLSQLMWHINAQRSRNSHPKISEILLDLYNGFINPGKYLEHVFSQWEWIFLRVIKSFEASGREGAISNVFSSYCHCFC